MISTSSISTNSISTNELKIVSSPPSDILTGTNFSLKDMQDDILELESRIYNNAWVKIIQTIV